MSEVKEESVLEVLSSRQIESLEEHIGWQAILELIDKRKEALDQEILSIAKDPNLTFQERGERVTEAVATQDQLLWLRELPAVLKRELKREELIKLEKGEINYG